MDFGDTLGVVTRMQSWLRYEGLVNISNKCDVIRSRLNPDRGVFNEGIPVGKKLQESGSDALDSCSQNICVVLKSWKRKSNPGELGENDSLPLDGIVAFWGVGWKGLLATYLKNDEEATYLKARKTCHRCHLQHFF